MWNESRWSIQVEASKSREAKIIYGTWVHRFVLSSWVIEPKFDCCVKLLELAVAYSIAQGSIECQIVPRFQRQSVKEYSYSSR